MFPDKSRIEYSVLKWEYNRQGKFVFWRILCDLWRINWHERNINILNQHFNNNYPITWLAFTNYFNFAFFSQGNTCSESTYFQPKNERFNKCTFLYLTIHYLQKSVSYSMRTFYINSFCQRNALQELFCSGNI